MAHGRQLNDRVYQNWIKAGLALKYGKTIISDFLAQTIEKFRLNVLGGLSVRSIQVCHACTLLNIVTCPTNGFCFSDKSGKCKKHDICDNAKTYRPCPNGICDKLYTSIKSQISSAKGPSWSQSDPTLWCSNVWEIAKCFMPVGYQDKHDIEEYDFSGIMSLIINCKFIQSELSKPYDLSFFQKLRDARNGIMHSGTYSLSDDVMKTYVLQVVEMVKHVLNWPLQQKEQLIYEDIQKLTTSHFCVTTSDQLTVMQDTMNELNADNKSEIAWLRDQIEKQQHHSQLVNNKETRDDESLNLQIDEKEFLETRASKYITNAITTKKSVVYCLVVVGAAGSGKTTLIHHEALRLQQQGNFLIIHVFDPSEIVTWYDPNRNQVFVCDDCFGATYLNRGLVDKFEKPIKMISNKSELTPQKDSQTILLMSSRLHIYKEARINHFDSLDIYVCDLTSNDLCLSDDEHLKFLKQYLPECADYIIDVIPKYDFFPLMCKIAKGKKMNEKELLQFVEFPIETINKEILAMKEKNKEKFCCL